MRSRIKKLLGRPSTDSFYTDPDDYYNAINDVISQIRVTIANQYPDLLYEESSAVSSSDSGLTFPLPNSGELLGRIRVFEAPGIRTGAEILPATAGMLRDGWRILGTDLTRTIQRNVDLYFLYIPQDHTAVESGVDSPLPNFMDEWIVYKAAARMARVAGSMVDPQPLEAFAGELWRGDPQNPMDTGIMGMLSHYRDREGWSGVDYQDDRWWGRLTNG